jgi:hypothetical protein
MSRSRNGQRSPRLSGSCKTCCWSQSCGAYARLTLRAFCRLLYYVATLLSGFGTVAAVGVALLLASEDERSLLTAWLSQQSGWAMATGVAAGLAWAGLAFAWCAFSWSVGVHQRRGDGPLVMLAGVTLAGALVQWELRDLDAVNAALTDPAHPWGQPVSLVGPGALALAALIADAERDGRQRLVEMNEPVRLNLVRIIDGLEALEDRDGR